MKVMVFVKATKESEAGMMPDEKVIAEMGRFKEELVKAGVMLGGEGLHPSSKGKRLRISDGKTTLIDGPFAEAKELVGGYWLWQVRSLDDAVAWARRCADYMPSGEWELEVRPLFDAEDFGEEFTPALREQDERLRAEIERQRRS
ncbi:YciI family protein [Sorangium sp. So ce128]|uniref:YciI family protein n=1 Tax=Sorangium sp. So ce128 TaxID=3133281 RepID=UPI003F616AE8